MRNKRSVVWSWAAVLMSLALLTGCPPVEPELTATEAAQALADLDRSEPGRVPGGSYLFSADATVAALPYAELQRFVAGAVDRVTGRG